jgi:hypothetical protein
MAKKPLIVRELPKIPRAEAIGTLRTSLQILDIEPEPHSFVVTSSVQSEVASTGAVNLEASSLILLPGFSWLKLTFADLGSPATRG